jgi:hypothetical protein
MGECGKTGSGWVLKIEGKREPAFLTLVNPCQTQGLTDGLHRRSPFKTSGRDPPSHRGALKDSRGLGGGG